MVIAAGAEKRRLASHALPSARIRARRIERQRAIEIGDFQVHVTDVDPGIDWVRHAQSSLKCRATAQTDCPA